MCSLLHCCLLTLSALLLCALSLQHAMNLYGYQCPHSFLEPFLSIATNILECFDFLALSLLDLGEQFDILQPIHTDQEDSEPILEPESEPELKEPPPPTGWWDWWYGTDTNKKDS